MNANDRKACAKLADALDKIEGEIAELIEQAQQLADDEQEKFDNMSEGLQASERGEAISEAANNLESWASDLAEAHSIVETLVDNYRNVE